jgi:hypothetical protein
MDASRVALSTLLFALVITLVLVSRPGWMFLPDGTPRPFGASQAEGTPFSLGTFVVVTAILSFFTIGFVDLIFAASS